MQNKIDTNYRRHAARVIPDLRLWGIAYPPYEQMNDMRVEGAMEWQSRIEAAQWAQRQKPIHHED